MPSDFLSAFLDVDEEFCKGFCGLDMSDPPPCLSRQSQRVLGFQRRHSLCPVTLPNSKFNSEPEPDDDACWGLWSREFPRSSLSHIPFRVDRSVSMIEGRGAPSAAAAAAGVRATPPPLPLLLPPPGLSISQHIPSAPSSPSPPPPHVSTRYKTELCRTFEESGSCKYGSKCQFAHGPGELRGLSRHPKYKTEPCRTFHTIGFCPYGARCHFIHNADEIQQQRPRPPALRHSFSFSGFSSSSSPPPPPPLLHGFQPLEPLEPRLAFTRACSVSPPPSSSSCSSTGSPELLSPLFPEPGALRHCPGLFSGVGDLSSDFSASCPPSSCRKTLPPLTPQPQQRPGLLRCSSADTLSEEGYATSSCSLSSASSGTESPDLEGRRLPIFSRLSVPDE